MPRPITPADLPIGTSVRYVGHDTYFDMQNRIVHTSAIPSERATTVRIITDDGKTYWPLLSLLRLV